MRIGVLLIACLFPFSPPDARYRYLSVIEEIHAEDLMNGKGHSKFRYRNMKVSTIMLPHDGAVTISAEIKNTGKFDGDEVIQLYVRFIDSKVQRPEKQLKGVIRTHIKAGETKNVTLTLKAEDLAYPNEKNHTLVVETGKVELQLGASSTDIRLRKTITVSRRIIEE